MGYKSTSHSLHENTMQWVLNNVPRGPILKFGGKHSHFLREQGYDVFECGGKGSQHIPLKGDWYDLELLLPVVKSKRWNAVIMDDGFSLEKRMAYLKYYKGLGLEHVLTYIDGQAVEIVDTMFATGFYEKYEVSGGTVLLPSLVPNNKIAEVNIFLEGGLGNRISNLVNGMVASKLYNKELIVHWNISEHMKCLFSDLFENDLNIINYERKTHKQFVRYYKEFRREFGQTKIKPNGGLYFGPPNLYTEIDLRYKFESKRQFDKLVPVKEVRDLVIDLKKEVPVCQIRTLAKNYMTKYKGIYSGIIDVPDGCFLTTESEHIRKKFPNALGIQKIYSEGDVGGKSREKDGVREALAEWYTITTAKEIFVNSRISTFTKVQRDLFNIPYTYKSKPTLKILNACLPPTVYKTKMWEEFKKYCAEQKKYEIIEYSTKNTAVVHESSMNFITWGVKWHINQYRKDGRNILFFENGLLGQKLGSYCDSGRYFQIR